jgi:ribosomal protein L11 methyltransferase
MRELTPEIWHLTCRVPEEEIATYAYALTEFGASVAWDHDRTGDTILLDATFPIPHEDKIDAPVVQGLLEICLENFSLAWPETVSLEKLEDRDWISENRKSFPPLTIGSFFIYGSHYQGSMPEGLIPIELDASIAFGSGEHATTRGSLLALEHLIHQKQFEHLLDMGCGSGILCLAAAKLLNVSMIASDVDPDSVLMSIENMHKNGVSGQVEVRLGDGYAAIHPHETFDLILSNILAQPLIEMAPSLTKSLRHGGNAVLSGFLDDQAEDVVAAHVREGLMLVESKSYDGWVTAVLAKE